MQYTKYSMNKQVRIQEAYLNAVYSYNNLNMHFKKANIEQTSNEDYESNKS